MAESVICAVHLLGLFWFPVVLLDVHKMSGAVSTLTAIGLDL